MVGIVVKEGTVAVPEWLHGRFPIERDAVLTRPGERPRQWKRVPLSRLSLIPRDHALYELAVYCAARFVRDMATQGFGLIGEQGAMLVTGPYAHLESDTGDHAIGRQKGQEQDEPLADFVITGRFLRSRPQTFEYRDPID